MRASPWILRPPGGRVAALRLFCFPYAGGGGSAYMPWGRETPCPIEVCAVQLPGREGRLNERPYTQISDLIDVTFEALRPHLEAPFALFGHSMGALLAFEFARRIRHAGGPAPVRLIVSGHRGPRLPRRYSAIAHLPDAEFIGEICQRYGGVPEEVLRQPELMALLVPCLRADMALIENYRYRDAEPLECPISAFGGREDPEATETQLSRWEAETRSSFSMRQFAGTHFYIRDARKELLAAVCRDLADVGEPVLGATLPTS
jgi:medium-chain acyl-[acyl-carrier-protein] hydrolase